MALLALGILLMIIGGLPIIDGVIGLVVLLYYFRDFMQYQGMPFSGLIRPLGTTIIGIIVFALGGYLCDVAYRNDKQKEVSQQG